MIKSVKNPIELMLYKMQKATIRQLSNGRDDKIRTCDPTPPRRVLYRAELHPASTVGKGRDGD